MLTWLVYALSQHPECLKVVQKEIDEVVGDRYPTIEDIKVMPEVRRPARKCPGSQQPPARPAARRLQWAHPLAQGWPPGPERSARCRVEARGAGGGKGDGKGGVKVGTAAGRGEGRLLRRGARACARRSSRRP